MAWKLKAIYYASLRVSSLNKGRQESIYFHSCPSIQMAQILFHLASVSSNFY